MNFLVNGQVVARRRLARYLRIFAQKITHGADKLQVSARNINLQKLGFPVETKVAATPRGWVSDGIYMPRESSPIKGVFSELTTLLQDLSRLPVGVETLDSSTIFTHNSSPGTSALFEEIFSPPRRGAVSSPWLGKARELHHSVYRDLPWREIRPLIDKWFQLKPEHKIRATSELNESGLVAEETLAVNLRGSQKFTEIAPTPIPLWVELTERLLSNHPELSVVVFSDDQDLVDEFTALASFEVFDLGQEIRTRSGNSIVSAFRFQEWTSRFTLNFISRTWLISQCKLVVTHTGNGAFWTALFRGCTCGFYQFTRMPGSVAFPSESCDIHST